MDKHINLLLFLILAVMMVCCLDSAFLNKEEQADDIVMLMHDSENKECFDKAHYPFYSDAEQYEVSQNYQRINSFRHKRLDVSGNSLFFSPNIQRLYTMDGILSNYSNKVYSNSNGFISQSVSGYYVFALRHIII